MPEAFEFLPLRIVYKLSLHFPQFLTFVCVTLQCFLICSRTRVPHWFQKGEGTLKLRMQEGQDGRTEDKPSRWTDVA